MIFMHIRRYICIREPKGRPLPSQFGDLELGVDGAKDPASASENCLKAFRCKLFRLLGLQWKGLGCLALLGLGVLGSRA